MTDPNQELEESSAKELEERLVSEGTTAMGFLDDMRITARDVAKHLERAGVPIELHWESIQIMERLESLEARVGDYMSQAGDSDHG